MNKRNVVRNILFRIEKLKVGDSIIIDDLAKEFTDLSPDEILSIISTLATRYIIKIDGKYSHECHTIEKYNKIVGLDRDGFEGLDAIRNNKIWEKVEDCLKEYNDASIFIAITLAKKIIEKEFDKILDL